MHTRDNTYNLSQQRGFTLIELLVVVSIIGLLSSIVLVSLSSARKKGIDAGDYTQYHQIQVALEMYANDHNGSYPLVNDGGTARLVGDSPNLASTLTLYLKDIKIDSACSYCYYYTDDSKYKNSYVLFMTEVGKNSRICVLGIGGVFNVYAQAFPQCGR